MSYASNQDWVLKIQPYAISQHYRIKWPNCEILCLDDDDSDELKKVLDVSGADKLIKWENGTISFLGQRFRRWEHRDKDDFTLRVTGSHGGVGEAHKAFDALEKGKLLAAFYAYGHVNQDEISFIKFRIIDYRKFLELVLKEAIPKPSLIPNKNKWNRFYAWSFDIIPDECIIYEYKAPQEYEHPDRSQMSLADYMKVRSVSDAF